MNSFRIYCLRNLKPSGSHTAVPEHEVGQQWALPGLLKQIHTCLFYSFLAPEFPGGQNLGTSTGRKEFSPFALKHRMLWDGCIWIYAVTEGRALIRS
jgi:hypothetical protein